MRPEIEAARHKLRQRGFTVLPIVPEQDPFKYPKKKKRGASTIGNHASNMVMSDDGVTPKPLFTGKNPSRFINGKPVCICDWQSYQSKDSDFEGVRSIGVVNNVEGLRFIDYDRKHFSSDNEWDEACKQARHFALTEERTPGGAHFLIRFENDPLVGQEQMNIGFGNTQHAGEIPGFAVVSPSIRANGEQYVLVTENPAAPTAANLQSLGLYPSSQKPTAPPPPPLPNPPRLPQVQLLELASKKIVGRIEVAESGKFEGDRSREIVAIAQELYAWERLAREHGVSTDSADTLIRGVAEALGIADKVQRCLKNVDRTKVEPALARAQGLDTCQEKLEQKAGIRKAKPKPIAEADTVFLGFDDKPGPIAHQYLFSEGYVRIEDSFYKYEGTHYEKQDERHVKALIAKLFERCIQIVEGKKGELLETRPYRTSAKIKDAYEWALTRVRYIPLDEVNPPGVNCLNGVLLFPQDKTGTPQPKLVEHSPDMVFVEPPQVAYHPEADDTHALRLLEAISPSYRDTVLRVFASAIDLEAVRKAKGRAVRSLIFTGSGANGKDALREAVTYIFGKAGLTSCTVDDFHAYDQGRRFNLARLAGSRINWASENRVGVNIDDIQSLKQMISGDPLVTEEKFKQGQEFTPRCISVFSTNDRAINLTASLEAIASRYAIVPFTKTFVSNPTKAHELPADPRFKYDLQWVKSVVCPALLNILIEQYQNIFAEGIDYSAFEETMADNRLEVNHLLRFAQDFGLEEDTDGQVSTDTLWEKLRIWYEQEGILKVDESNRDRWEDDVRAGDSWVKGKQQLKRRLQKIFPTIESFRTKTERGIKGIRFVDQVEKALIVVNTLGDYLRVVDEFGNDKVQASLHKLPDEVRSKITNLQPEDEVTDADIQEGIAMATQAVKERNPEILGLLRTYPITAQKRILHSCPLDIQAGVQELKQQLEVKTS